MNSGNPVRRYSLAAVIALLAVTMPAACTQEVAGSSRATLAVSEPGTSSSVSVPFTLKVVTNVRLGDPSSGDYHVHVYFDDHVNEYIVMTSPSTQVTKAPAGAHVMHLSLRNANHSAAGVETSIALTIGSGGSVASPQPPAPSSPSPSDDPYKFDY
jgi:hypothetical protein